MAKKFPRLRDGDEPEPWHFNVIYRELERWSRLQGTGGIRVSHADPPLIHAVPYDAMVLVKSPSGGIPKRNASTGAWGSATVTHYEDSLDASGNFQSAIGTATETAYNKGPGDIPGTKDVWCYRDLLGRLIAVDAFCATPT